MPIGEYETWFFQKARDCIRQAEIVAPGYTSRQLARLRWPKGVRCPICKAAAPPAVFPNPTLQCMACREWYACRTGTALEHRRKVTDADWLAMVFGICFFLPPSVRGWARLLNTSHKTAWYICRSLRQAITWRSWEEDVILETILRYFAVKGVKQATEEELTAWMGSQIPEGNVEEDSFWQALASAVNSVRALVAADCRDYLRTQVTEDEEAEAKDAMLSRMNYLEIGANPAIQVLEGGKGNA